MNGEMITSFQKAPNDTNIKCGQCGTVLALRKGQLVPPCPRCGFRQFETTQEGISC